MVPWCRTWLRRVSHSCIVEKLVEIPESKDCVETVQKTAAVPHLFIDKAFTRWQPLAASEGALDDEEFFVIEGWMKPLLEASPAVS